MTTRILWNRDWEFCEMPLEKGFSDGFSPDEESGIRSDQANDSDSCQDKEACRDKKEKTEEPSETAASAKSRLEKFPERMLPADWKQVSLPHDWQIAHAADLYRNSIGFYRKHFSLSTEAGKRYELYFEGVYMDARVYLNKRLLGEWKYGYSSFFFDMTELLQDGENELLVMVVYEAPNSRWYSGAGIYRDVWLIEKEAVSFVTDGVYLTTQKGADGSWELIAEPEITANEELTLSVTLEALPGQGFASKGFFPGKARRESTVSKEATRKDLFSERQILTAAEQIQSSGPVSICMKVSEPELWSPESPNLYLCTLTLLSKNGEIRDCYRERIGFKYLEFDHDRGLFLNGAHLKLQGVCEHHDLGCLGASYHSAAMRRKMKLLREMGVNAIRCAHNMPAPDLLDLADEEGFLVMNEAFDMWERSKTDKDYARFFWNWYQKDIESFVRRDRNHACLLFWSIGNEIYDIHADAVRGAELTAMLRDEVRKHDPRMHAMVTMGSNYMPWENAHKSADVVKYIGYNYAERLYEDHHRLHPDWYLFGSETSSTVQSRGIYHFPYEQPNLSEIDEQCSSLGNCTTSWGARSSEACILAERDTAFSMGQFLWSGFDYLGEPTPYQTRNSYFGQLDTAGFEKDTFYLYQAEWTDAKKRPMGHLFPYWNFNDGQMIDVRACTNAASVELFVNGRSQGEYRIDHEMGRVLTGNWKVPYEEGEILAVAYNDIHEEIARDSRHSFSDSAKLILSADRDSYENGIGDLAFIRISAVDRDGYPVENACDLIRLSIEGDGLLAGMDNGDSTDTDEYQTFEKRLFSGKALAVIGIGNESGEIMIRAEAEGLQGAELQLCVKTAESASDSCSGKKISRETAGSFLTPCVHSQDRNIRIRQIRLFSSDGQHFSPEKREIDVRAEILPANASSGELRYEAVDISGIRSNLVKLVKDQENETGIRLQILGDGKFVLRCIAENGCGKAKVISTLEFTAEGIGPAFRNPYEMVYGALAAVKEGKTREGQEHAVFIPEEARTVIIFESLDFQETGSDRITVSFFEYENKACPVEIWEGIPNEAGSRLLGKEIYREKTIWGHFQEESWKLEHRIQGITSLSFVISNRLQMKGFRFEKQEKAWLTWSAAQAGKIYGDQFAIEENCVSNIGNNVSLVYERMNFGTDGTCGLYLKGKSYRQTNTIHLIFEKEGGQERRILEFSGEEQINTQYFSFEPVTGCCRVQFVFLPGSHFDFYNFTFVQADRAPEL